MLRVLLGLLCLLSWRGAARAEVVEQIIAIVDGHLLFLSDLERHRTFFESQEVVPPPDDWVARLIDEQLLDVEARKFIPEAPSDAEVDARMAQLRVRFSDGSFEAALRATGWAETGLKDALRRHLWIERLLRERVSSFIFVSQESVDAYNQAHPDAYPGLPKLDVQRAIREHLEAEKERTKRQDYLQRLRAKAIIQVNPR